MRSTLPSITIRYPLKNSHFPCKNQLRCHRRILNHSAFLIQHCSPKSGRMEIFLVTFVCLHPKKSILNNTQNCPRNKAPSGATGLFPGQAHSTGFPLLISSPRRGGVCIHPKWTWQCPSSLH